MKDISNVNFPKNLSNLFKKNSNKFHKDYYDNKIIKIL